MTLGRPLSVPRPVNDMKKCLIPVAIFILFFVGASPADADTNRLSRHISMKEARMRSLREFDRMTGGKLKSFRCSLVEETSSQWIFSFDDYENPKPPGGADLLVFVNKRTGLVKSLFGK